MGHTRAKKLEEYLVRESLLILSMIALALVQMSLLPTPLGSPPTLLLVLVVCRVLLGIGSGTIFADSGLEGAARWAFYGGLTLDIGSATPLGSHALALLGAVIVVAVGTSRLRVDGPLLPLISVLIGALVYEVLLAILVYNQFTTLNEWHMYAMSVILPSVLLTLIPALPLFFLLRWLFRVQ